MKKWIIIVLITTTAGLAKAQTFDEWFNQTETQIRYLAEQIGALKAYREVINKGYDIAHKGLSDVFQSKDGDFFQHNNYFNSLWKVKPDIRTYSKAAAIYEMNVGVEKQRQTTAQPTEYLSKKEMQYINSVFLNLLSECKDLTVQLEMIITDGELQLKDDERIERIEMLFLEMQDRYLFSRSFGEQVRLLVLDRVRQSSEVNRLHKLYGKR